MSSQATLCSLQALGQGSTSAGFAETLRSALPDAYGRLMEARAFLVTNTDYVIAERDQNVLPLRGSVAL